ncbi:vWA domain-containing protein [Thermoanaerobacterium butyriciformans]|uniref:Metal-dependent peptidase n=1 Tax=Thermoanaerobacterium butyriciformans TaxID=1702242 RepID=A0ABS4NAT4_9THEO|nr:VWA-like domain-containing protein [Thermoanaerobacterium butyriciformans]MBP2070771.1 putative metal-dependent peptidase [Thermoanaerobacterium butyriciformans]
MTLPMQLQAARLKLAKERPYLASALWALQPVEFKKGTMAVDMYWRLYYNPKYIDKLTIDEFSGALYHEICHLLRQHNQRMKNFPKKIANIAADIEVNNDLIDEGVTMPKGIITRELFGLPENLLAEEYAVLLMQIKQELRKKDQQEQDHQEQDQQDLQDQQEQDKQSQQQMQQQDHTFKLPLPGGLGNNENSPLPGSGRCGSCATGQLEDWELPEGKSEQPGITESEAELIRRNVAVAIQQASMQRGDVPAHLKRWADKKLKPKVNWKKELATVIKNTISNVAGCIDYSYSKPSRRSYKDIIMPSLRQPSISVAVVVDTSGSVSDNMLSQALAEIDGILKSVGLKNGVHYIACDAEVHVSKKITDIKQAELEGGGGTDMGVGIKAAMSLKPRPNVCIVLTDGYTPWPDTPPQKMKVIAGLLDLENETWQVPSWAKKVLIRAD